LNNNIFFILIENKDILLLEHTILTAPIKLCIESRIKYFTEKAFTLKVES